MAQTPFRKLLSFGVLTLLAASLSAAPDAVDLTVEQVGDSPFPYQGIRVRITLRNSGQKDIADLKLPEHYCFLIEMKGPTDSSSQPIGKSKGGVDWLNLRPRFVTEATAFAQLAAKHRLALKPGEKLTISGVFQGSPTRPSIALFSTPGNHSLLWGYSYQPDVRGFSAKANPFAAVVQKPEKDEVTVANLFVDHLPLIRDYTLALIYRDSSGLRMETVRALETIVNRYPKSSYADYARFALADYCLQRNVKDGSQPIPEADVVAAIKYLEAINVTKFAYGADTLIRLRNLCRDKEPEKAKMLEIELRRHFWDAIEWIDQQAVDGVPFEKIMADRKGPPK